MVFKEIPSRWKRRPSHCREQDVTIFGAFCPSSHHWEKAFINKIQRYHLWFGLCAFEIDYSSEKDSICELHYVANFGKGNYRFFKVLEKWKKEEIWNWKCLFPGNMTISGWGLLGTYPEKNHVLPETLRFILDQTLAVVMEIKGN